MAPITPTRVATLRILAAAVTALAITGTLAGPAQAQENNQSSGSAETRTQFPPPKPKPGHKPAAAHKPSASKPGKVAPAIVEQLSPELTAGDPCLPPVMAGTEQTQATLGARQSKTRSM